MFRRKHFLFGLLMILILSALVLSGCGSKKGGTKDSGDNNDPVPIEFNTESFEGTTWESSGTVSFPLITVNISEIIADASTPASAFYTGSVDCASFPGPIDITEEDITLIGGKLICLLGVEAGGTKGISFSVYATNDDGDAIGINGFIHENNLNTVEVHILTIDYADEEQTDFYYDEEESSETIVLTKQVPV
jgi:hypothetical protein